MQRCRIRGRGRDSTGYSLVETTVALALVSVILLSGLSLLFLQPRILERTHAAEDALHAMEAALETLRAGELPLEPGLLAAGVAYPAPQPDRSLRLTLELEPGAISGLYELRVVATYAISGGTARREITTMAWRP